MKNFFLISFVILFSSCGFLKKKVQCAPRDKACKKAKEEAKKAAEAYAKEPLPDVIYERLLTQDQIFTNHSFYGYVFSGKHPLNIERDFKRKFYFTDRPNLGYGIFTFGEIDSAISYARTYGKFEGVSIFKIKKERPLRVLIYKDVLLLPDVKNMLENKAWKKASEIYKLDAIVDAKGGLIFQNPDVLETPSDWSEHATWMQKAFELVTGSVDSDSLVQSYYADSYLQAEPSVRNQLKTPEQLAHHIIQTSKSQFDKANSLEKRRYIEAMYSFEAELTSSQIKWILENKKLFSRPPFKAALNALIKKYEAPNKKSN